MPFTLKSADNRESKDESQSGIVFQLASYQTAATMKFDRPRASIHSKLSRREFLAHSSLLTLAAAASGCKSTERESDDAIIDIHQHVGYSGRPDDVLLAHQCAMGVAKTILLPAGRPVNSASTHEGISNGLQAKCLGNEACYRIAKDRPREYLFGANEVPD